MSFEIVYTSVRRGLRTGSKGFCTVAATEGISRALQDKLESLSGYTHHEAAAGAVNYSHLIIRLQRKVYHVLSRVADAGKDYSGRTNKIAHHLALTTAEAKRFGDGPASLFGDEAFWYESWHDGPEELPPNRLPDAHSAATDEFVTWEAVFGDAGWAGVLGRAAASGMKPVSIIVPNGHNTKELLEEALQLVPPKRRWNLCFSTYFSRQAPGTECHWKFVLDRTQEARRMRARSGGGLVDFSSASGKTPGDDPFVQAAREGRPHEVHNLSEAPKRRRAVIPERPATKKDDHDDDEYGGGGGGGRGGRRRGGRHRRRRRDPPPPRPTGRGRSPFDVDESQVDDDERESEQSESRPASRQGRRRSPGKIGLWLVLFLSLGVGAILVFFAVQQLS